jgi:hypothetical protein
MNTEQFERLNTLSEKAINDTATINELEEFNHLLIAWNQSTEYNLLQATYTPNSKD